MARCRQGHPAKTSFLIIDAQSVSNTDSAKRKGYDAGKKVSGITRHIGVDSQGLADFIVVTTAEVTDRQGALDGMGNHQPSLDRVAAILVDGGYSGKPFSQETVRLLGAEVSVAKRNELHKFAVIPQRWVVERSFA